jgi:hypothetical protein
MRGQALNQLGLDALLAGDVEGARAWLAAGAKVHRALFDQEGLAYCLDGFAAVALAQGRAEAAARLLGAANRTREVVGLAVWPLLAPLAEAFATGVRTALGDEAFRRECATGAALRPLDALGYALQATAADAAPGGQAAGGGAGS